MTKSQALMDAAFSLLDAASAWNDVVVTVVGHRIYEHGVDLQQIREALGLVEQIVAIAKEIMDADGSSVAELAEDAALIAGHAKELAREVQR